MEALCRSAPVPITFEAMAADTDGYFSADHQKIAIRQGMSEVQTVSATVHEIAHSKLHNQKKIQIANDEQYQEIEMFDKPGLFSNGRIARDDLPEGVYCYDLRGSDYDPGEPVCVEERVVVNHAGSVLLTEPLELAEDGRLMLTEEEGLNFVGGFSTLAQFLQEQRKDRHTEEVEAESISYAVCKYFGIETGENSFGYIASWSRGKELKELRASLETINKTSGTLISDIERHYKEICKERGIDPNAKAEPETAPIEQPTGNLTYYVAECMEFPNLGEYHDNLSLEEAVRIYQEIPAERMNGIKGIGFELKDGSDYEGPFPILTGQTIDLDTIQAIDYYRDNPLVQKAVKELAAAIPEMEVLGADANQQEALFLIDDATYLHIQPCDSGWDYTLYDAASMKEMDGGQMDMPELSRMKAVLQICDDNDLGRDSVKYAPLSMIETLQEAAYQQMQAEVGQMAASSQLPEAQEQALDEYPMPDEQVSTPDMQEYGYSYDGMLPVTRERALELDAADLTVYVLHEDNTESMVFDPQEIMDHGGLFGVDREEWEKSPQFHEKVMERQEHQQEREQAFLSQNRDTEFLPTDPDKADQDLRDVLAHGLMDEADKKKISTLLQSGRSNSEIAYWLSRAYSGEIETLNLETGDIADYLAQRAELLGAIRLPNDAFKKNAGAEVVSDIIFFQKRDHPLDIVPEWTQTGQTEDGFTINRYFIDHPEMVLGRQEPVSTAHGMDYTVNPIEGLKLSDQLHDAVKYIHGTYQEAELPELGEGEAIDTFIPADPNVKNYSYAIVDGQVYYRENSRMVRPDLNTTAEARVKGLVGLRDCVQELIDLQMDAAVPDSTITQKQAELNSLYDSFSEKYGLINDRANRLAYADDSSYYLLCALEVIDEDGKLERKADMFTKRTIKPHQAVAVVDTASEALAVSISEKACVNMSYMSQLTGKTKEELAGELQGVIFRVPGQLEKDGTPHYVTADEYLSGNVRRKLRQAQRAAQQDPVYAVNVEALTAAQPKDLDASEIEVRLGATWIDKEYIRQFMYETFNTPFYLQRSIEVNYSSFTAEWQIKGKSSVSYNDVAAYTTYGTSRANAYKILEDSLNLRDVRIYDTIEDADGKERRMLNAKETTLAAQKQQAIREAFRDWIWRDPERRQTLVRQYNEEMNSTRPREYDGSHITFGGMNPAITLREHQKSAIAHVLYGGNTLLAHEVGAGKTFEMVAAAMEAKRLGLCQKSLFVVPNHLTEQWASEFLRLYPSANILVTTKKDFETHNRKKFCARIATGDYDAIIMGHSQFERIPISRERQERLLYEQIDEITEGIAEVQASGGERFTVKQLERTRKSLEARLEKLQAEGRKDDVVTFEQLGVDRLFVDEAHNYKNLFLYTKMRNVAGLSTSDAQKSSDMFAKCRYMDEITGNRGVIFATGTPVSNSMTELYTMQRYLQYERLQELNMTHFDCWASRFGETVTALELAPEGTGYRARTRFSKFFNLPELMNLFKEVADIKTADQLNLPTPEVEYHNIVAQPTEHQQEMVKALSERASLVHSGTVDPSQDNMLKITSDGRKLGLDQRIVNQMLPDEPGTKVNQCVENIMQIWRDGEADKLTQLVFCDISTPQAKAPASKAAKTLDNPLLHALEGAVPLPEQEPAFTVYDDIRQKLIAQGMPADQIAFIHEANTEVRKKELFSKVRTGQVRVLMGSTAKMGAGTNVQDRLVALHDLDCPWRPGDVGRILRTFKIKKNVEVTDNGKDNF